MRFYILILFAFFSFTNMFGATLTWVGTTSSAWNVASNWSPAQVPLSTDNVIINSAVNDPGLVAATTVNSFTINSGVLTQNTYSLNINGTGVFSGGVINDGTISITSGSVTFSGTTIISSITATCGAIYFNGSIFNGGINVFTQNGAANTSSTGGNTFNGLCDIILSGTGNMTLGSTTGDVFAGNVTFKNNSTSSILSIAHSSAGNQITGNVKLDNGTSFASGSRSIHITKESSADLSVTGTLYCDNNNSQGCFFGLNGGQTTFENFSTFGTFNGFVGGSLQLANVRFKDNLVLWSGTFTNQSSVILGPGVYFENGISAYAPRLFLNGGVYHGVINLTKVGSDEDLSLGGNTFSAGASFVIENNGTGNMVLGAVNPDKFYCDGIIRNSTTDKEVRIAENSAGNEVTGTLRLENGTAFSPGTRTIHVSKQNGATLSVTGAIYCDNNNSTGVFFGQNGGQTTFQDFSAFGTYNGFAGGTLQLANVHAIENMNVWSAMFSNGASLILGPGNQFDDGIYVQAPRIFLNGGVYNGTTNLSKTGANDDLSLGGNIFNTGSFTIENSGTGNMVLGTVNPDEFICNGIIKNSTIDNEVRIAESSVGNEVVGTLRLDNGTAFSPGLRTMHVCKESGATLSVTGAIYCDNNNSVGIYFGENGGETTFQDFSVFGTYNGFAGGTLQLANVHAIENMNIWSAMFSNGASLILGPGNLFDDGIYVQAPRIFLNGGIYKAYSQLTKTGSGDDNSLGGNTFDVSGTFLIENNGTGNMVLGTLNPDKFNGDGMIRNSTVDKEVRIAESSVGNEVVGILRLDNGTGFSPGTRTMHVCKQNGAELNVTGSLLCDNNNSTGYYFGQNGGQTTFDNFSTFGSYNGFAGGTMHLKNVHAIGYINVWSAMFSNGASLILGPDNFFESGISVQAPRIFLNSNIFHGNTELVKTGAGNDLSLGGNTFENGNFIIVNSGSGDMVLGTVEPDKFFSDGIFSNLSSDNELRIAESSSGNEMTAPVSFYNGPGGSNKAIHIAKENSADLEISTSVNLQNNNTKGIFFGENGGQTTFLSGYDIGSSSFAGGTLLLANIHAETWMNLGSSSFTGDASIKIGPQSVFDNGIVALAPRLFLNGGNFTGPCQLQKTGAFDDLSDGGNVFNPGSTYFINNFGTGDLVLGNVNPDKFNGICQFFNATNDKQIRIAEASAGNEINGTVTLTNAGSGGTNSIFVAKQSTATLTVTSDIGLTNNGQGGIFFGEGGGNTTFNSGASLSSTGFSDGTLLLSNVTSNVPVQVTFMSNVASLKLGPSNLFNNTVQVYVPRLFLNGGTYQMASVLAKYGSSNDESYGSNNFNALVTLRNAGDGNLNLANDASDYFNQAVNVINTGTGNLDLAYSAESFFRGDLSFNLSTPITSGTNGGYVTFANGNAQTISSSGSEIPVFSNLRMNKTANDLQLNWPIKIGAQADFLSGKIYSSQTNYLEFLDNAVTSNNESDLSFVHGPVRKTGDDFFVFPIGKGSVMRPSAIDAPSQVTDVFTGEYFPANSNDSYPHSSKVPSLVVISTCDYWTIDRTNGTSSVNVWLSWRTPGCNGINDMSDLTVARWDAGLSQWQDQGNGGTFGDNENGYMTSAIAPTNYSPFALASLTTDNPLPVELLEFNAVLLDERNVDLTWTTASEYNSSHFELEKSKDGIEFTKLADISAAGFSSEIIHYQYPDELLGAEQVYYRLKQVDKNGAFEYSPIRSVRSGLQVEFLIYPNPIKSGTKLSILSSTEVDRILITDILGNVIQDATYSEILTVDLPSGSYQLRLLKDDILKSTQHLIVIE